jgi:hypothetical protein
MTEKPTVREDAAPRVELEPIVLARRITDTVLEALTAAQADEHVLEILTPILAEVAQLRQELDRAMAGISRHFEQRVQAELRVDRSEDYAQRAADGLAQERLAREASEAQVQALREALQEMTEDLEARWDMNDPRTNPGIRHNVERARSLLEPK